MDRTGGTYLSTKNGGKGESNNNNVNLVSEYSEETDPTNVNNDDYFCNLSEHTIDIIPRPTKPKHVELSRKKMY